MNFQYVEVLNSSNAVGQCHLQYILGGKTVTDVSGNFVNKEIKRMYIPDKASSIKVIVGIVQRDGSFKGIYQDSFKNPEKICYEITGSKNSLKCEKINCSKLKDTDFIYAKNKSKNLMKLEVIYTIGKEAHKQTTSAIKQGRGASFIIPRNADIIQFKVYMSDENTPVEEWQVVFKKEFKHPFNVCYDVAGKLPYIYCEQVPCNQIGDPIPPSSCCCCCCCCKKYTSHNI